MADPVDPDIIADDKSWTWVLERVCGECSFDVRDFDRSELARWCGPTPPSGSTSSTGLTPRCAAAPSPAAWSTLEYACHVRDVFRVYDARLERMLTEDAPTTRTGTRTPRRCRSATASRIPPW